MNKLDLIQALRDAADLTKPVAERVVTRFFNDMGSDLANGGRVEIRDSVPFLSRNTGLTLAGIRKRDSGSSGVMDEATGNWSGTYIMKFSGWIGPK